MKRTAFAIGLLGLLTGFAFGQSGQLVSEVEDTSPALRIINGTSESLSFTVTTNGAGDNMTVVIGSTTNTIDGSGSTDTIAELATAILAATNSSGTALSAAGVTIDQDPSLGTDSTDGELLDGTYTAAAGATVEVLYDTSQCKFWQVYLPDRSASGSGYVRGGRIQRLIAEPSGTGDVTVDVYYNRTKVYRYTYTSPYYVKAETNATNVASQVIEVDLDLDIPRRAHQAAIIRVSRATTATTGPIAVIHENPYRED